MVYIMCTDVSVNQCLLYLMGQIACMVKEDIGFTSPFISVVFAKCKFSTMIPNVEYYTYNCD